VLPIDLAQGRPAEIETTASVTYGANDIEPLLIEFLKIFEQYSQARRDFEDLLVNLISVLPDPAVMMSVHDAHSQVARHSNRAYQQFEHPTIGRPDTSFI
jgi:hypothetical protein